MQVIKNRPIRVAILGGTGFAGRNVRNVLESAGMTVGIFSRTTGADLLDLPGMWSKLDPFRPDYIVNCAALVGSINYVSDFAADVMDVNMRMLLNIYKIAQQMREVVVVHPIANCSYPGVATTYKESEFWSGPVHSSVLSYGSTRRMIWALARCYFEQYGVRSVNLFVPNMYGPYDSTNPNKTHALNALVIKFVRAKKYKQPSLEVWGTGNPIREWLYARDFANVVQRVISSGEDVLDPVNIGQKHGYSVSQLVEVLRRLTNYDGKIEYNTGYADGSPCKVMDNELFQTRFPGFQFTALEQGLQETLDFYQAIL